MATNLVMSTTLADRADQSALKRFLLKQSLTDGAYTSALKTKAPQIAHLGLFVFAKATDANRGWRIVKLFEFVSHLSGITILCCMVSSVLRNDSFIYFDSFLSFSGGMVYLVSVIPSCSKKIMC